MRDGGGVVLGGMMPLSLSDFPGTVAAVLFTRGCQLDCGYCHNRELLSQGPMIPLEQVQQMLERRRHQLGGVVITGGEPTLYRGLLDLIYWIKKLKLKVKLDTNGLKPEVIHQALNFDALDYVALDFKGEDRDYIKLGGRPSGIDKVLATLYLLRSSSIDYELRTTVCDGLHTKASLMKMMDVLLPGERWRIQNVVEVEHDAFKGYRPMDERRCLELVQEAKLKGIDAELRGA